MGRDDGTFSSFSYSQQRPFEDVCPFRDDISQDMDFKFQSARFELTVYAEPSRVEMAEAF